MPGSEKPVAFEWSKGRIKILLGEEERELITDLAGQFRSVLTEDTSPDLRRLYPTAYPDDADKDSEYASLVHEDLLRSRLTAVETVEATAQADSIDADDLAAWMGLLSSLRLLLGTRIDISEEDGFDPDAPDAPIRALLAWLGLLLEESVAAAATYLPPHTHQ
ncbi:MAG: DUF2017 family protein [Acidimicrobiales bacterium]|jgi:hypothetical protein|nr:DUF2017 family protein [Acidimicrobiales bacterium]MDP7209529.1 DUF2017 family protein [Acidimicrobiales bacterium]HJO98321.1 DUF2017 family protein [Acidimicrobiales bacterium]|tara:strand:- start:73 stop:561 length:489 start_codon:yes stop_codon:yes gene_type:complete